MKTNLTILTLCAVLPVGLLADDTGEQHDHGHDHQHGGGHDHDHGGGHDHPTIVVPESLDELWAHINACGEVVTNAAGEGDFDLLHEERINLETLLGALPGASGDLDADEKGRVEGMVGNAQRALGQLHDAADAEDLEAARDAAKGLADVLSLLKAQYPEDVTGGTAEIRDDIGPHEGIVFAFHSADGETAGYLELKLHDDKGDLELWLAEDADITRPFDLPASTEIAVDLEGAKEDGATLAVRNRDENEGEDGEPNMRDGKTNYFIFPGDSGADSTWLTGGDFEARVQVSFSSGEERYETDPFLLIPHTHHEH